MPDPRLFHSLWGHLLYNDVHNMPITICSAVLESYAYSGLGLDIKGDI